MEERELRSRVTWVVGLVLATAFVATIIWSVAQDSDDSGGSDQLTFDETGEEIGGQTTTTFGDGSEPIDPTDLLPPHELPEYTLTVHTDGCGVIRTEESPEPDNLSWVINDLDGFQVLGRNALGETQYRYFEGGDYTVVLETWGGDRYLEVSNTVQITC